MDAADVVHDNDNNDHNDRDRERAEVDNDGHVPLRTTILQCLFIAIAVALYAVKWNQSFSNIWTGPLVHSSIDSTGGGGDEVLFNRTLAAQFMEDRHHPLVAHWSLSDMAQVMHDVALDRREQRRSIVVFIGIPRFDE